MAIRQALHLQALEIRRQGRDQWQCKLRALHRPDQWIDIILQPLQLAVQDSPAAGLALHLRIVGKLVQKTVELSHA
ncbi:hypothetical protein D3C76_980590 [compost metagenome]